MYDLIGDIHGCADELVQLLEVLGYRMHQGVYSRPERKVIFLGDFIDWGPQIGQVLKVVRPMIEEGDALSVMGNHELNALAYHTPDPESPGEHLRPHIPKNVQQHSQTVEQLNSDALGSYLEWFRSLPLWLDLDGLRVVHACWNEPAIKQIAEALERHRGVTTGFLQAAYKQGDSLFDAVEIVLKGKEAALPEGISFQDKDGHVRTKIRTRWYRPPEGHTYRTYALQSGEIDCDLELEESVLPKPLHIPPTPSRSSWGITGCQPAGRKSWHRTWRAWTTAWPRAACSAPTAGMASRR